MSHIHLDRLYSYNTTPLTTSQSDTSLACHTLVCLQRSFPSCCLHKNNNLSLSDPKTSILTLTCEFALWDFKAILQFAGYILTQYWTNHSHFSQYKLFRPQKMEKRAKVKKNASLKCVINSVNTTGTLCQHCTNTSNHQEAVLL